MALDGARQLQPDSVLIPASQPPDAALRDGLGADRIDIAFETFKDGRGFSLAALLRAHGFAGSLRAVGPLLPDQEAALKRVGFDEIVSMRIAAGGRGERQGFADVYQPDPDGLGARAPAMRQRALAARRTQAEALARALEEAAPDVILAKALEAYHGRIALLSSFGAEAALGLKLLSEIAPDTPVLFLDTKRHFPQTLSYRDQLIDELGLKSVRIIEPDAAEAAGEDADGKLFERDGQACCDLRKVRPLARALEPFDAVITGRKRHHGGVRSQAQAVEFDGERVQINPLAYLGSEEIAARFAALKLPRHPLTADGYSSIGCWPCTAPARVAGSREGRWAGQERSECGIFDPARADRAARAKSVRLI